MTKILALLAALALAGCAASSPPVPGTRWTGTLNMRGGAVHQGNYLLTLSHGTPFTGDYAFSGPGCLEKGVVKGERSGGDLKMSVTDGASRMEINAGIDGGVIYGRYEFTRGPCKGDWGSTVASPLH